MANGCGRVVKISRLNICAKDSSCMATEVRETCNLVHNAGADVGDSGPCPAV